MNTDTATTGTTMTRKKRERGADGSRHSAPRPRNCCSGSSAVVCEIRNSHPVTDVCGLLRHEVLRVPVEHTLIEVSELELRGRWDAMATVGVIHPHDRLPQP